MFWNNKKNKTTQKQSLVLGTIGKDSLLNLLNTPMNENLKTNIRKYNVYKEIDRLCGVYGEFNLFCVVRCAIEDRLKTASKYLH